MRNKLAIACSFRSFTGGENDLIQKRFLDSLRSSSDLVSLVVTQFGEIGIHEHLIESGLEFDYIESTSSRWSHTEVFGNAVSRHPNAHILWTTVDVELNRNVIIAALNGLELGPFATSWPHYSEVNGVLSPRLWSEIDSVFVSNLICPRVYGELQKYPNIGWGLFEHQLTALSFSVAGRRGLNLHSDATRIIKSPNPRFELAELPDRLREDWKANRFRWLPWLSVGVRRIWALPGLLLFAFQGGGFFAVKLRLSLEPILSAVWGVVRSKRLGQ